MARHIPLLATGFTLALATSSAFANPPTAGNAAVEVVKNVGVPTVQNAEGSIQLSEEGAKAIEPVIRKYILEHPEVLHEALYNYQIKRQMEEEEARKDAVKKLHKDIYESPHDAYVGPKDSKKVIVEFFDYNCSACKQVFGEVAGVLSEHPDTKIIFKEFPIFGESSVENARIGLAVFRLHPEKYKDFFQKMMTFEGRSDVNQAIQFASDLGMDVNALRKEAEKQEITEIIAENRSLGEKLKLEGTPSFVIKDELIGHGLDKDSMIEKLNGNTPKPEK
jgi:protein-disulfide isomerase